MVVLAVAYGCPAPLGHLMLIDRTIDDDDPQHRTFVTVSRDERTQAHVLRAGSQQVLVPLAPDAVVTARSFVRAGAIHLIAGYDHLLFLLSLVLGAAYIVRRDGLRPALVELTWIVTAFTLGHSLSLSAAAVGWVILPSQWVEVTIAASVVAGALLNLRRSQSPTAPALRLRVAMAAGFGLVHGLGLSSVLAQASLPSAHRVVALLAFNLGVELAQLAFVAAVLGPLVLIARGPAPYRRLAIEGGSLAIAFCGLWWLAERSLAPLL